MMEPNLRFKSPLDSQEPDSQSQVHRKSRFPYLPPVVWFSKAIPNSHWNQGGSGTLIFKSDQRD